MPEDRRTTAICFRHCTHSGGNKEYCKYISYLYTLILHMFLIFAIVI